MKLGALYLTHGVNDKVAADEHFAKFVNESIRRHITQDWGEICEEDKRANNEALKYGERILSAFQRNKTKIWIITEADRSSTTILFPDEY